jgi:hypothetical protein
MTRIVCDTNVLISAFIFPGGPPEEIFHGVIMREFKLGIPAPILEEFKKVLRVKFTWPEDKITGITELIQRNAALVPPKRFPERNLLNILKHPQNDKHRIGRMYDK